ncbi:MAG: hydroxymethylglutaryl-CoA reductase, degradative [Flavobacteriaceae bacterium]|nr:hydroxymethylglutaryl-CoA reductase, degradative [Flavobacteriaceae bacterium]
MKKNISGFSKLSKNEKIDWLIENHFNNQNSFRKILMQYWNSNSELQNLHDDFIENSISNYYMPLAISPNFIINSKYYTIPMVIEESSVVAAASKAANYWSCKGGFKSEILSFEKLGHVHFIYDGSYNELSSFISIIKPVLFKETSHITNSMKKRGGGILSIDLIDKTDKIKNYYQLKVIFNTIDSMGANFINSCLEKFSEILITKSNEYQIFLKKKNKIKIIMSILSNYLPNCIVKASVKCEINLLDKENKISRKEFAEKFVQAVNIAKIDPYRAVTHNKGIMNGIDSVVLATGNDFRAVEANAHAYSSRNGKYSSLSNAWIENNEFNFELKIPLSIGTVGGLTNIHPLVKWSLKLLNNPDAKELMEITAAVGLAQNFAAIRSLITNGIQKGHMKMHLINILNQLNASSKQKEKAIKHFKNKNISHQSVNNFLNSL